MGLDRLGCFNLTTQALPFFEKCDNYGPTFTLHTLPRNFSETFSKSILLLSVQNLDIPGPSTSSDNAEDNTT
ncbi:hypothetical protein T07_13634 [Trichinella nelsoni]|uniref:Uncharacterized protein n=1 Tax=Trichinella nelsoni TaxID=6336 RepID=A0A0V0RVA5_9BILA|nr:hypothetical protein T07_13634 [Trichinella nelsoni]